MAKTTDPSSQFLFIFDQMLFLSERTKCDLWASPMLLKLERVKIPLHKFTAILLSKFHPPAVERRILQQEVERYFHSSQNMKKKVVVKADWILCLCNEEAHANNT